MAVYFSTPGCNLLLITDLWYRSLSALRAFQRVTAPEAHLQYSKHLFAGIPMHRNYPGAQAHDDNIKFGQGSKSNPTESSVGFLFCEDFIANPIESLPKAERQGHQGKDSFDRLVPP
ncbi:hypothetical protein EVAR_68300_1 [Eumeta japonica]|uniref:Uncharacterized protein n=1 Tax=Eumeta variegata TaxID=151549 RepID=A0A4C2AAR9_EUMVA|nr:hypothetical protein EVAR_68300_1 [Eumeta japonica]